MTSFEPGAGRPSPNNSSRMQQLGHLALASHLLLIAFGCSNDNAPTADGSIALQHDLTRSASSDAAELLQAQVEPSVVYLQFWTEAGSTPSELAGFGTGFVIADPSGTNWILTTAHSLATTESGKRISSVRYRLPRQQRFAECKAAIIDEGHDLAVLRPHPGYPLDVEPLTLADATAEVPRTLYALGSATALELALYEGHHIAELLTIEQWAKRLLLPVDTFHPLGRDVVFLRHGIAIAPGYSGCPILTADARVVGIQSSHLKGAPFIGFAIHVRHIHAFNWSRQPMDLADIALSAQNRSELLVSTDAPALPYHIEPAQAPQAKATYPLSIALAGVAVDAPIYHNGYVERDALIVIQNYVQDKEWYFQEEYGGVRVRRLQELLDRTRLARLSNPLLGLDVLVPEGYTYSAVSTEHPDGFILILRPPAERVVAAPYDCPLSIWVTVESGLYKTARIHVSEQVRRGELAPTKEEVDEPQRFAIFRDRLANAMVADKVIDRFAVSDLQIRFTTSAGEIRGHAGSEIFQPVIGGEGSWHRTSYFSQTSSLGHTVRIGNRDPVVVTAHYQFAKEDHVAFVQPTGSPDQTFCDFAIISASISTK